MSQAGGLTRYAWCCDRCGILCATYADSCSVGTSGAWAYTPMLPDKTDDCDVQLVKRLMFS